MCKKHYMRLRRTGTTDENPEPHKRRNPETCTQEGCDRRSAAFGLCDTQVCSRCNTDMGFFQDDPALLRRAASYLDGPSDNE